MKRKRRRKDVPAWPPETPNQDFWLAIAAEVNSIHWVIREMVQLRHRVVALEAMLARRQAKAVLPSTPSKKKRKPLPKSR